MSVESMEQKLKHLLMKAWRERWSDLMWGIYVKEVIPSGTSGDTYDLANQLLIQALVGPSPNPLLLSYLKHSLSVQMISYAAVFRSVSAHGDISKPRCIKELLLILQESMEHVNCSGSVEQCASLASSLLSLEVWLLNIASEALNRLCDTEGGSQDYINILNRLTAILEKMHTNEYLVSMLFIGVCTDEGVYVHLMQLCHQTESCISQWVSTSNLTEVNTQIVERLRTAISRCESLERDLFQECLDGKPLYDNSLCTDIHTLISWEALLRPTSDGQALTQRLDILQKLRGYSPSQLYCEILRACCLGLAETADSSGELRWAVFTFLKTPSILLRLHRAIHGMDPNTPIVEPSGEVASAFERLLCYPGLLETTDAKCHCNVVDGLLNEVKMRTGLLSEWHVTSILSKRESLIGGGLKLEASGTQTATLILRAEPTVTSILKTLDTDYNKNQDTLLAVLSHLLSGKSFELILNAATGTGKLRAFATKLVRFNEANRQPGPDPGKSANVRALLFDISFLMLCRITQMYGIEVILTSEQHSAGCETFFEQWASEWLKPGHAPDLNLTRCDQTLTDQLLKALTSGDSDLRSGSVRWHEACLHVPAVIREILEAWQAELINDDDVERILDSLRTQMCCLSVCAAAWLRYYIQVQPASLKSRPTSMLQHLTTPLNQMTTEDSKEQYRERTSLMLQIVQRLSSEDGPLKDSNETDVRGDLASLDHQFTKLWDKILKHGWPDHNTTTGIERLYHIGGATWLMTAMVKATIKEQPSERRQRCVDGALAVAHLDLEACAIALATKVLPVLITRSSTLASDEETGGPGGKALAELTVWLFVTALNCSDTENSNLFKATQRGLKRQSEWEELCLQGIKQPSLKKLAALEEDLGIMVSVPTNYEEPKPLHQAITKLMQLMIQAAQDGIITPQLSFVSYVIQTLVHSTDVKTVTVMGPLLNLVSPALVFYMLAIWPDLMSISDVVKLLAQHGDRTGTAKVAARIVCSFKNTRKSIVS